jgi:hypothetical protein
MFDPVGLAALDPKVAAYKKFIKENLNQPDLLQFLQSEQGKRLDPNLAGAMLVLEKLEQAKNGAASGPAPTTTVVQDVSNAAMQEAQKQGMDMLPDQGIAQLPNPAMGNAQFQGGITQSPQRMAGGGIVAFDGGGSVEAYYQNLDPLRASPEDREVLRILKKGPPARTPQDNAILKEVGFELSQQEPASEDGIIGRANRALGSLREPFIRGEMATISDEELAKRGGTGAINERIYRGLGGSRYVAPVAPSAAPAAPAAAQTSPVSTLPTDTNPFSQTGKTERQALNFMEALRGEPEAPPVRKEQRSTAIPGVRSVAPAGKDETPKVKSIEGYEQELVDLYTKRGIGKATDEYRKYLQEERDSLKEQGRVDTSLALAKAGFRMMASTSPFAAVGIGEGGQEFASQMMTIRKDQQANNRSMREAQFRLAQADETQAAGRIKEAMSMRSDAEKQLRDAMQHRESMQFRYAQLASEQRRSRATLAMQQAVLEAQGAKDANAARVRLATAKQEALRDLGDDTNYTMLQSALQKAQKEGDEAAIKKAEKAVRSYRDSYLAPIESAMGGGDAGATSSVVDWNDLFGT